jgi:hypothetical protein
MIGAILKHPGIAPDVPIWREAFRLLGRRYVCAFDMPRSSTGASPGPLRRLGVMTPCEAGYPVKTGGAWRGCAGTGWAARGAAGTSGTEGGAGSVTVKGTGPKLVSGSEHVTRSW